MRKKLVTDAEKEEIIKKAVELMHKGLNLGGGPYYKNRGELYERTKKKKKS